jgi:hypothetical protein
LGFAIHIFFLVSFVELATPAILEMAFSGGIGFLGFKVQGVLHAAIWLICSLSPFLGWDILCIYLILCGFGVVMRAMGFRMIWVMSFFCCDMKELSGGVHRIITA